MNKKNEKLKFLEVLFIFKKNLEISSILFLKPLNSLNNSHWFDKNVYIGNLLDQLLNNSFEFSDWCWWFSVKSPGSDGNTKLYMGL